MDWISLLGALIGFMGFLILRGDCLGYFRIVSCDEPVAILGLVVGVLGLALLACFGFSVIWKEKNRL